MTTPVICAMGTWVKGVGEKPCRNRARYLGYYTEAYRKPVCGRHTAGFAFLGSLDSVAPTHETPQR